jgi:hypothetical protein
MYFDHTEATMSISSCIDCAESFDLTWKTSLYNQVQILGKQNTHLLWEVGNRQRGTKQEKKLTLARISECRLCFYPVTSWEKLRFTAKVGDG